MRSTPRRATACWPSAATVRWGPRGRSFWSARWTARSPECSSGTAKRSLPSPFPPMATGSRRSISTAGRRSGNARAGSPLSSMLPMRRPTAPKRPAGSRPAPTSGRSQSRPAARRFFPGLPKPVAKEASSGSCGLSTWRTRRGAGCSKRCTAAWSPRWPHRATGGGSPPPTSKATSTSGTWRGTSPRGG